MKKILLIDDGPRRGGNSEIIVDTLVAELKSCEVTVFKMREKDCRPCKACDTCQNRDAQMCVQQDDITPLLPLIDLCDAMVIATPIYNNQITSQAKLLIERFYPFFRVDKENMSNSTNQHKKAALVCSFWGSPTDVMQECADWTVSGFSQVGAVNTKALVFDGLHEAGKIRERKDYLTQLQKPAGWLSE